MPVPRSRNGGTYFRPSTMKISMSPLPFRATMPWERPRHAIEILSHDVLLTATCPGTPLLSTRDAEQDSHVVDPAGPDATSRLELLRDLAAEHRSEELVALRSRLLALFVEPCVTDGASSLLSECLQPFQILDGERVPVFAIDRDSAHNLTVGSDGDGHVGLDVLVLGRRNPVRRCGRVVDVVVATSSRLFETSDSKAARFAWLPIC